MNVARAALLAALAQLALPPLAAAQSIPDETGLTALIERLGAGHQPTGAGVVVAMTEAKAPGYLPDPAHPEFAGKTFVVKSSGAGVSGHATTVGRHFYGLATSIAPGVDTIDVWEASHWMGGGFLNGSTSTPPDPADFKVINHSWIGAGLSPNTLLRKLDFAVELQDLVVVVGVNNGSGTLDQPLLSHGFNLIAVGRSDGLHRAGPTGFGLDGPGRHKPELVAPAGATSFSTPLVSGAATLLVETARTHPALAGDPEAERADLLKAALMAGAEHRPGWSNNALASGPLRGTTSTPLDDLWGADEIDVNVSHWILTGGRAPGAPAHTLATGARHAAWDAVDIASGESRFWRFSTSLGSPRASVTAAWNRHVSASFVAWQLPDLDLQLWRVDAQGALQSLVGDPGLAWFGAGNVVSSSQVENVEHLHVEGLAPGEYALELRRHADAHPGWKVAVAWDLSCPEPAAYGSGKVTSLGQLPQLTWRGFASVAADELHLEVTQAVPGSPGVAFWGEGQASIPFYGGTLLVQPPVTRLTPVTLDASGAATMPVPLDASWVGRVRDFQFWFRDPAHPDGTGVGLTSAVEIPLCE